MTATPGSLSGTARDARRDARGQAPRVPRRAGTARAGLALASAVGTLGLLLLAGARSIGPGAGYDRIGPRAFPLAVAATLLGLGLALGVAAVRARAGGRHAGADAEPAPRVNPAPLLYLALSLVAWPLLAPRAGFVAASAVQFWCVARAFHSRRPARDAFAALAVSLVIYLAFTRGLGLTLPAGPLRGPF